MFFDSQVIDISRFCPLPNESDCQLQIIRSIQDQLHPFSHVEATIFSCIWAFFAVTAFIGNAVIVLVVLRRRRMWTNQNLFVTNMAVSSVVLALALLPLVWIPSLQFDFDQGAVLCKLGAAFPASNVYCSTLTICVLAVDRYHVVRSIRLVRGNDRTRSLPSIATCVAVWLLAILLSGPLFYFYDIESHRVINSNNTVLNGGNETLLEWSVCRLASSASGYSAAERSVISMAIGLLQVCFLYVVPLAVLILFNAKLTAFIFDNARTLGVLKTETTLSSRSNSVDNSNAQRMAVQQPQARTARSVVGNINRRMSRGLSLSGPSESSRRVRRTTLLMIAMAASYGLLWLPFTSMSILYDLDLLVANNRLVVLLDQSFKCVAMSSICINPFVYGYLNTNIKAELRALVCRAPQTTPRRATIDSRQLASVHASAALSPSCLLKVTSSR